MKKRSHRLDKMARVYDDEILPIWAERFGRMVLRDILVPPKAMVLDVGCATGFLSIELLKRMDEHGRIIAIDPLGPLLDVARKKAGELAGKRIFFRSETSSAKLAFADDVYDLVVSNLGLPRLDDPPLAVSEFARVAKPGALVVVSLPLRGTYAEFFDIYREVLVKGDQHEVLEQLERHVLCMPEPEGVVRWMEEADLSDVHVDIEEFSLLFRSSREFFFAPVIEFGPLSTWKVVAGKGQEMQEIFWRIKEAIDAYFGERAFALTIKAGCVRGRKESASEGRTVNPPVAVQPSVRDDSKDTVELAARPASPKPPLAQLKTPVPPDFQLDDED